MFHFKYAGGDSARFAPIAEGAAGAAASAPLKPDAGPSCDCFVSVALDHPHGSLFDYRFPPTLASGLPQRGTLVSVPFGRRQLVGLIWAVSNVTAVPPERVKDVIAICASCRPLDAKWLDLVQFAAQYYQRGLGEVALPALPQTLRDERRWMQIAAPMPRYALVASNVTTDGTTARPGFIEGISARATAVLRIARALESGPITLAGAKRLHPRAAALLEQWHAEGWLVRDDVMADRTPAALAASPDAATDSPPALTDEQDAAVAAIGEASGFAAFLLFGVTGSGKTEVYLQAVARKLAEDPLAQALVLVPEINLTPQLEARFRSRFAHLGPDAVVTLHSGLAEGPRARQWLAAHEGRARIVLGTRLAVLASFTRLAIVVVDEEHEAAYKQQEGLRYSARDLAVWRAKQCGVPVVLGSASPSLESWWQADQGRYRLLTLKRRPAFGPAARAAAMPTVRLIDVEQERQRGRPTQDGFSAPLIEALQQRLSRGEQSLIFINRRGYAPVLTCDACGWVSGCPRCSAYLVLHKTDRSLRCHHCGWQERIPPACKECGNVDIAPLGRGTQRTEEALLALMPQARVVRIDADSTRRKGSAAALFANVHAGEVDILVGTHMIAKGHDFQNVTLVGVLNADAALFSHDFRAGERLFAQLLQVAGRAGRSGQTGEVLIQTRHPEHTLYGALRRLDFDSFARSTLAERRQACFPPFLYQALLRAEAKSLEQAMAFLHAAGVAFDAVPHADAVTRFDAVPMALVKIANTFRAQLLIESASRGALQRTLSVWNSALQQLRLPVVRWAIDVDPLDI